MLAGHWGSIRRERRFMVLGFLASAAAILDVTLLPNLPMLAAGFAFIGLVSGRIDVAVLSLRQHGSDPAWLSRVLVVSISLNTLRLAARVGVGQYPGHPLAAADICCRRDFLHGHAGGTRHVVLLGRTRPTPPRRGRRPPGLTRLGAR